MLNKLGPHCRLDGLHYSICTNGSVRRVMLKLCFPIKAIGNTSSIAFLHQKKQTLKGVTSCQCRIYGVSRYYIGAQ